MDMLKIYNLTLLPVKLANVEVRQFNTVGN